MTMSRAHFAMIAATLREEIEIAEGQHETYGARALRALAPTFADRLASTNPRFDRERFLAAALPPERTDD